MASGDLPRISETLPNLNYEAQKDCPFLKLPLRVRELIWHQLDFDSLKSMSETCAFFEDEILQFISPTSETYLEEKEEIEETIFSPTFQNMININFMHLKKYLDFGTILSLRLVCKGVKAGVDYHSCLKITVPHTSIFHLFVQDLKRIISYLDPTDLSSLSETCMSFSRLVLEQSIYPFKEFRHNPTQLSLMDLPTEIHAKILDYVNPKDKPSLRLVSKLMQFQLDTLSGVKVYLNDMKFRWRPRTLRRFPPASTLIVTEVSNLNSIKSLLPAYNSKILTQLILDGPFLSSAFLLILKECSRLKFIGLTYSLRMSSVEEDMKKLGYQPFEMNCLTALNLKMRDLPQENVFRLNSWSWMNAFELMKPTLMIIPRLTSFSICEDNIFSHNMLYDVADKILKFIAYHRFTLKYLEVILLSTCRRECICPPYHFANESELADLKLVKYSHDCDWKISRPFTNILTGQGKLWDLSCLRLTDWEFYSSIILNNLMTLTRVTIEKNLAPLIDLGVFSVCENLTYLMISQGGSAILQDPVLLTVPRLTNLDKLPQSLKHLFIIEPSLTPSQIEVIPQRLFKLETLQLQFLGNWDGSSGPETRHLIRLIFNLRNLQNLFLEEVKSISCGGNSFETFLDSLNQIPRESSMLLANFGCAYSAFLIADSRPSYNFMIEWKDRVDHYFLEGTSQAGVRIEENFNFHQNLQRMMSYLDEFDENEEIYGEDEEASSETD